MSTTHKSGLVFSLGNQANEVDVQALISSLAHTATIVRALHESTEHEGALDIRIKAFKAGSFEVHIELVQTILKSLFSKEGVEYATELCTLVALCYGGYKWLKGRTIRSATREGEKVRMTLHDGDSTLWDVRIARAYLGSDKMRKALTAQFEVLLSHHDIEELKVIPHTQEGVEIGREEFEALAKTAPSLETEDTAPRTEVLEEQYLQIVRPSFDPHLNWDFVYRGQKITARVQDERIKSLIDNGTSFRKGDHMLVDLECTMYYNPDYATHMITKDSYRIVCYHGIISAPRAGILFDES